MQRESQNKMILDMLSSGQRVTVRQLATKPIYSMYGGKRLSELKERGIDIRDHWVEAENGKRYKEYFLPKSEIKRIKRGKNGQSKK